MTGRDIFGAVICSTRNDARLIPVELCWISKRLCGSRRIPGSTILPHHTQSLVPARSERVPLGTDQADPEISICLYERSAWSERSCLIWVIWGLFQFPSPHLLVLSFQKSVYKIKSTWVAFSGSSLSCSTMATSEQTKLPSPSGTGIFSICTTVTQLFHSHIKIDGFA